MIEKILITHYLLIVHPKYLTLNDDSNGYTES